MGGGELSKFYSILFEIKVVKEDHPLSPPGPLRRFSIRQVCSTGAFSN